jgi:hypothetical protein
MKRVLSDDFLKELLPSSRSDDFFEALYGGAETGAFDIALAEDGLNEKTGELHLAFLLTERPGKCMACHLTTGMPSVFERHPVIDAKGIVKKIEEKLDYRWRIEGWKLGTTLPRGAKKKFIPFVIILQQRP